jgi:hypothetical protein
MHTYTLSLRQSKGEELKPKSENIRIKRKELHVLNWQLIQLVDGKICSQKVKQKKKQRDLLER